MASWCSILGKGTGVRVGRGRGEGEGILPTIQNYGRNTSQRTRLSAGGRGSYQGGSLVGVVSDRMGVKMVCAKCQKANEEGSNPCTLAARPGSSRLGASCLIVVFLQSAQQTRSPGDMARSCRISGAQTIPPDSKGEGWGPEGTAGAAEGGQDREGGGQDPRR